jgi:predicted nucleic acid-binding protein
MAEKMICVLDACALIAFLDAEDGCDRTDELLARARDEEITLCMNIINLVEVYYEAGRLKAEYKISLADAIGLSTAICLNATFVTSDHHELEKVEQDEAVPFLWIR